MLALARIYAVMYRNRQHTYQVLTKRPDLRRSLFESVAFWRIVSQFAEAECEPGAKWIWEGVSVEDFTTLARALMD